MMLRLLSATPGFLLPGMPIGLLMRYRYLLLLKFWPWIFVKISVLVVALLWKLEEAILDCFIGEFCINGEPSFDLLS